METLDDLKGGWKQGRDLGAPSLPLKSTEFNQLINGRIKKEQRLVWHYAVKTYIWSVMVFSYLSYLMIVQCIRDTDSLRLSGLRNATIHF